jgi:hypothetical protein
MQFDTIWVMKDILDFVGHFSEEERQGIRNWADATFGHQDPWIIPQDIFPDPAVSNVTVLSKAVTAEGNLVERIETEAGQYVRVTDNKGNQVLLTKDR